jgi:hypothetical protein
MLGYAVETAQDFRVARAEGVESEMELPFAALQQLCAGGCWIAWTSCPPRSATLWRSHSTATATPPAMSVPQNASTQFTPGPIAHGDPVAARHPGRAQAPRDPRGPVPQLPVGHPLAADLDHGLHVQAGLHLMGEHRDQRPGQLCVARHPVAVSLNTPARVGVVRAGNLDNCRGAHSRPPVN